jgi:hypothetical protein
VKIDTTSSVVLFHMSATAGTEGVTHNLGSKPKPQGVALSAYVSANSTWVTDHDVMKVRTVKLSINCRYLS